MTPRKANAPALTREQIVAAALKLVDESGLEALTMRRLAAEFGVRPMALYYHVPDKSALHDLIIEAVFADVVLPPDLDPDPERRVIELGNILRDALLAHPHAVPLVMSRSLRTPGQLRPVEELLGVFFGLGLGATDAMVAVEVIGQYVFGTTLAYTNRLADSETATEPPSDETDGVTPEAFPNLVRAMREAEHVGWDGMFEQGLRALVRELVIDRMPSS